MPRFIIKPVKDRDFYVEYSTIVDSWTFYGDRQEFLSNGFDEARLDRADEEGSSAFPPFYKWNETSLDFRSGYGHFEVERNDIESFILFAEECDEEEALKKFGTEVVYED